MKSIEQAKRIYESCISNAKVQNTLTYRNLLNYLEYPQSCSGQVIRYGLELVLVGCANMGLPSLTAIVVNQSTGRPSEGHPKGSWELEVQNVFNYKKWPNADELDWEYVWENRKLLSDKFGTPEYWGNKKAKQRA